LEAAGKNFAGIEASQRNESGADEKFDFHFRR
jgi:hypothetical protein